MQIDIENINKLVAEAGIKEVKTAVMFQNSNVPHEEGLASYEVFGQPGTRERRDKFGYIDLGKKFLHPQVYKILISLKRELYRNLINGEGEYTIVDGEIVSITPGKPVKGSVKPGNGINWLYDNWEKINFKPGPGTAATTRLRKETISLLSKDEIFVDKWLVIPAFYRDVDMQTNKRNEYNMMYSRIIRLASSIKSMSNLNDLGIVSEAEKSMQNTLFELYTMFITFFCGNHGFIHEHVMGKPTMYSARLIISAGSYNFDDPKMNETDQDHSGVPLVAVAKVFFPFMLYGLNKFFFDYFKGEKFIYKIDPKDPKKPPERKKLHPAAFEIISPTAIEKRVELYQNSTYHRLEPVQLRCEDDTMVDLFYLYEDRVIPANDRVFEMELSKDGPEKTYNRISRLTWMHLFYMVAELTVSDKHVYITRYPIEDYNSIYPSLMNILPSSKYERKTINGRLFPRWPVFPDKDRNELTQSELDHLFVDTLKIHTTYLAALKADFDGDMVNLQGIYSDEANADAEKFMKSSINIVGINGESTRVEKDVLDHALYALTYKFDYEKYQKKVINY